MAVDFQLWQVFKVTIKKMDDVNDRHNFREDYYNISNTTVADGGERVVPIGKF